MKILMSCDKPARDPKFAEVFYTDILINTIRISSSSISAKTEFYTLYFVSITQWITS